MSSLLEDSFIAAPTPGGAAGPAHAAHDVEICGVPTKIALTAYSNRVFVVVTQTDNLGTLIAADHIRDEPQPAHLFEIPAGIRKFDPQALIRRIQQSDVWVAPPASQ